MLIMQGGGHREEGEAAVGFVTLPASSFLAIPAVKSSRMGAWALGGLAAPQLPPTGETRVNTRRAPCSEPHRVCVCVCTCPTQVHDACIHGGR